VVIIAIVDVVSENNVTKGRKMEILLDIAYAVNEDVHDHRFGGWSGDALLGKLKLGPHKRISIQKSKKYYFLQRYG
jgi:hypothetical protein